MQKKLIAVAVAGALATPAVALAQSTVQMYGNLYIEYAFTSPDSANNGAKPASVDMLQTGGSAIGFKGEEKLGGGMSAWFQCESTADPRGVSGDGFCTRNSAVGFKGGFGNFFVGVWDTPFKRTIGNVGAWLIKGREDMDRYLAAQLRKLDTDPIDYYLLHGLNGEVWDTLKALGVIDFLRQAIKDGRIVNAGFSFHGLAEDSIRIVDAYPCVFCQIQYNFLDQKNQAGTAVLKYAAAKNLGVIVMEPLRGGNLGLATPPPAVAEIWKEAKTRRTPVEWALRCVWNHPAVGHSGSLRHERGGPHRGKPLHCRYRPRRYPDRRRVGDSGAGQPEVPRPR